MPSNDDTPAPTRRFLPPPSTSSHSKSPALASVRRTPFQSSRPTQLPSSSSSFSATPRFQRPVTRRDDIQTSFDDEDETDSPISRNSRVLTQRRESIEREDDELEAASPLRHRHRRFTPAVKKRKVLHPQPKQQEPITISSSPEYEDPEDIEVQIDPSSPNSHAHVDYGSDDDPKSPEPCQSSKAVRFKPSGSGMLDSTPLSRTVFKPSIADGQPASVGNGPVLPEVFSPSRRKGKGNFISGGSAELVRSWVFNVAAQESQATTLPEQIINVSRVSSDSSGRFLVVIDDTGLRWLLPEQQKPTFGSRFGLSSIQPGSQLLLRGEATKWTVHADSPILENLVVAAYWEPVLHS